jgi:hypothetical protein
MKMNDIIAVCILFDYFSFWWKNNWCVFLAEIPCRPTQFRCPSALRNNPHLRCLHRSAICNGVANCLREVDEANCRRRNCTSYQYVFIVRKKRTYIFFLVRFQCINGLHVPRWYVCGKLFLRKPILDFVVFSFLYYASIILHVN